VYYSAQVFLMGAEFTWVYARSFGSMKGQVQEGTAAASATTTLNENKAPLRPPEPVAPARPIQPPSKPALRTDSPWVSLGLQLAVVASLRYALRRFSSGRGLSASASISPRRIAGK
jgi:hypothetical protein